MKTTLKTQIKSKKFGLIYPKNEPLISFIDSEGRIFVEHPKYINCFVRATKKNILEINNDKIFTHE